jgi:hypothetical protein
MTASASCVKDRTLFLLDNPANYAPGKALYTNKHLSVSFDFSPLNPSVAMAVWTFTTLYKVLAMLVVLLVLVFQISGLDTNVHFFALELFLSVSFMIVEVTRWEKRIFRQVLRNFETLYVLFVNFASTVVLLYIRVSTPSLGFTPTMAAFKFILWIINRYVINITPPF